MVGKVSLLHVLSAVSERLILTWLMIDFRRLRGHLFLSLGGLDRGWLLLYNLLWNLNFLLLLGHVWEKNGVYSLILWLYLHSSLFLKLIIRDMLEYRAHVV